MHPTNLAALLLLVPSALCVEGVIPLRVDRVAVHDDPDSHLNKRAPRDSFSDMIANQRFFYTTTVDVGTPAQQLNLLLDTGSSDTWVFGPSTTANTGGFFSQNSQVQTTRFDSSKSSSWKANNTNWQIQYGLGSASGAWGTDHFKIGGAQLTSLSIGVANQVSQISQGIIGLGRPEAESTAKSGNLYQNLPLRMQAEGLIGSAAYSLYMDDINSKSGTILFGGVDHSRYTGQLTALPIAHPRHLGVSLKGIRQEGRDTSNALGSAQVAVLDSGTSLTYVPQDVLINIQTALNANPSFAIGEKYYCDCNITKNLVLDFGSTEIKVPAYQFLWPIEMFVNGATASLNFPQNSCYLGIEQSQAGQDFILIGDNLLRSMYLVYDLSNRQIALGQAKNNGGPAQIEAITANRIPGVF